MFSDPYSTSPEPRSRHASCPLNTHTYVHVRADQTRTSHFYARARSLRYTNNASSK